MKRRKRTSVVEAFRFEGKSYLVIGDEMPNFACLPNLTASELDVARMLVAGKSTSDIAAARGTAARTIANQIAQIYRKSGVSSRAKLVALVHDYTSKRRE